MDAKVNLDQQFGRFHEHRSPKIVATVDDDDVKLVEVQGEFGDATQVGTVGERLT
jgi:hypothetical protein